MNILNRIAARREETRRKERFYRMISSWGNVSVRPVKHLREPEIIDLRRTRDNVVRMGG